MKAFFEYEHTAYGIDLQKPIDLSLPLSPNPQAASAWYCPPVRIEPVQMGDRVFERSQGASVNFRNVHFNPHGNGTHTECLGHIALEPYNINDCLKTYWFYARLLSVRPAIQPNGDAVILAEHLRVCLQQRPKPQALVLRTLPNDEGKRNRQYTETNPPYLHPEAARLLAECDIEHLLIDLPSVDRESDGGALSAHHIFWNYPQAPRRHCTITELIYVPNHTSDGDYILNLMLCGIENDAAPGKPILYALSEH